MFFRADLSAVRAMRRTSLVFDLWGNVVAGEDYPPVMHQKEFNLKTHSLNLVVFDGQIL